MLVLSLVFAASLSPSGLATGAAGSSQTLPAESTPEAFTVFLSRETPLVVELSLTTHDLFSILTRGTVVCSDGSTQSQLFAEGIPNPRHRTVIHSNGTYKYRVSLPAYFEAMRGRVHANRIVGRLRFWETSRDRDGERRKCGTKSPTGAWVRFIAHRVKGPPFSRSRRSSS
jgi:hypothetical protein